MSNYILTKSFAKAAFRAVNERGKSPVFIIGTGRCGTTLLVRILSATKGLCVQPDEANDLFHPGLKARHYAKAPTDIENIRAFTLRSKQKSNFVFKFVQKKMINYYANQCPVGWQYVHKSPMIQGLLNNLQARYPKAKFIHIYRNPVDVVLSLTNKLYTNAAQPWHVRYRKAYTQTQFEDLALQYWENSIDLIQEFKSNAPTSYFDCSYENLTTAFTETMADLLNFLGIDSEALTFDSKQITTNRNAGKKADFIAKHKDALTSMKWAKQLYPDLIQ